MTNENQQLKLPEYLMCQRLGALLQSQSLASHADILQFFVVCRHLGMQFLGGHDAVFRILRGSDNNHECMVSLLAVDR